MSVELLGDWFTFATRRPGPPFKVWAAQNRQTGWVCHSMEGWWATNDTLDDPSRGSWHGTLLTTKNGGGLIQHYALSACPWASGNQVANTSFVAWEIEGLAGTPMDAAQLTTAIRMYRAWRAAGGVKLVRGETLFDHNEVATRWSPNAGGTACPSNRWAPFYAWLASPANDIDNPKKEAGLTAIEKELIEQMAVRITNLEFLVTGKSGGEAVAAAKDLADRGISPLTTRVNRIETEGDSVARANISGHIANHAAQAGGVPEHSHEVGKVVRK